MVASGVLSALDMLIVNAAEVPRISKLAAGGQLVVNGKPYLILGGELGNSSAGTASQADSILPQIAKMHVNTVLMPVAWEQIEAVEGRFDFTIVDHWIDVAREQRLHLVVLWFGSWKNGVSSYEPAWVKKDTKRFPRAVSAKGDELEILSTRRGWKARLTMRSTLTERPGRLAFRPLQSRTCRALRMRAAQDRQLRMYTRC